MNLRTWGLVSDPIAMVQAFAELRYGVVAHTLENSVKYGHNLGHTPYVALAQAAAVSGGGVRRERLLRPGDTSLYSFFDSTSIQR